MRTKVLIAVGVAIALLLLFGCPKKQPPAPSERLPPRLLVGLPIEMSVKQRTTTAVPGTEGAVLVTVDDITRRQVMASLADKAGEPLLAPTSLAEGDSVSLDAGGRTYYLTLKKLDNELIGDDLAVFEFHDKPPAPSAERPAVAKDADWSAAVDGSPPDSEAQRIRQLIQQVGSLEGAVFIRNGEEHTPAEAAEHLQRKWDYAGDRIETAEQFIDRLASTSSTTGENYIIRLRDGTEVPAGEYLHQQLEKMAAVDD